VGDQISYQYKATGKIILLCILSFIFLDNRQEDRRFSSYSVVLNNRMINELERISSMHNLRYYNIFNICKQRVHGATQ
jgi:hypothetical protein